jgi:hypothetical protein
MDIIRFLIALITELPYVYYIFATIVGAIIYVLTLYFCKDELLYALGFLFISYLPLLLRRKNESKGTPEAEED